MKEKEARKQRELEERQQEREIILRQAEKYNREVERNQVMLKEKNDLLKAERQEQVSNEYN